MGAQQGDDLDDGNLSLIEHLETNLTNKQSVEKIADNFFSISQKYPPLKVDKLSQGAHKKLKSRLEDNLPSISSYDVQKIIKKAKKTESGVTGELPVSNFAIRFLKQNLFSTEGSSIL